MFIFGIQSHLQHITKKALQLFADNSKATVIIASIAFGMGMNLPNIIHSIILKSQIHVMCWYSRMVGPDEIL
jgi:superfamily II DNA helicase RecQ